MWDCVKNATGKKIVITLVTELVRRTYVLAPDESQRFFVNGHKTMAYVAFAHKKNDLVSMDHFVTLPQPYPPTSCILIKENATVAVSPERGSAEEDLKSLAY